MLDGQTILWFGSRNSENFIILIKYFYDNLLSSMSLSVDTYYSFIAKLFFTLIVKIKEIKTQININLQITFCNIYGLNNG